MLVNMRRLFFLMMLFCGLAFAGPISALNGFLDWMDSCELASLDTNYVMPHKQWWRIAYINSFSNTNMNVRSFEPIYGVEGNLNAETRLHLAGSVAFRGLGYTYTYDMDHQDMSMMFNYYGNVFGGEILFNRTKSMHGPLSIYNWLELEEELYGLVNTDVDVEGSDMSYYNVLTDFYVVLNDEKFSFPAALGYSHLQKKSAGSIILGGGYVYSGTSVRNPALQYIWGGLKHFSIREAALGAGYGYNFAYRLGAEHYLLFHFSLVPLVTVWNYYDDHYEEYQEDATFKERDSDETTWLWDDITNDEIQIIWMFRNSLNYNYKNFFAGLNSFFARQTLSKGDDLDYEVDLWILRAFVGVRF